MAAIDRLRSKVDNVVSQLQKISVSPESKPLVDATQNLTWIISELITYLNNMNAETASKLDQVNKSQALILQRMQREEDNAKNWWYGLSRQILGSLIPSFITAATIAVIYVIAQ